MADADAQDSADKASVIFSSYVCRSCTFGLPHPGDIAEATSLSSVQLPPSSYPLLDALPEELVKSGTLSSLQLEGVLYAATKHQQILPDGQRAGFFIGDGAGVGKGRQISAVILDNYVRGRRKHVWLSISSDLRLDAQRDLRDLGSHIKVINNVQTLDKETRALGLSKDCQTGVLFLTYSSLIAKGRLQQVIDWCGPDFDGCLVFDECHKAKNFSPGNEASSTKMSTSVLELQNRLPQARVLYCSATGVSEVGHMAYLTRMGLWGLGTAFKDFEAFLTSMKKRGVSFLEMLAMEMKAEGKYVARGLSFRDAEFTELEAKLTQEQIAMYDNAVALWRKLKYSLSSALDLTNTPGRDVWKMFWSAQQRFFKLMCVSIKVPTVVSEARAALEAGCVVILGLQTTGESADASVGLTPGTVVAGAGISTMREMLLHFVRTHFPVTAIVPPPPPGTHAPGLPAPPRQVRECVEMRNELLSSIAQLDLPPNFLDELMDQLGGPAQVAEMTGRKGRVVRKPKGKTGSELVYELRAKPDSADMDSLNVREKELFMAGKRLVAIISDAASTGISLHASKTAINQRRRVHLTIELPWSADKAIQQLGRSHRSNQVTGPIYKLVSTQVGGEKRFAAAVARRLQSLGALTRGDRRAASGIDLSEQNFDSPLGRRSLKRMYDAIVLESATLPPGVSLASVLREQIKQQMGRPDMEDFEAEALAEVHDPQMKTAKILALHKQLREYVDIMGVGVGSRANPNDTTAENTDGAPAGATAGAKSGAAGKDVGDVKRFLNRLLGLPLQHQNLLFAYFAATLSAEIGAAKKEGKYSEGLSDVHSDRISASGPPTVLWADPMSGLKTMRNEFTVDRGVGFQDALASLKHELAGASTESDSGFRRSRRLVFGMHLVLLAIQAPGSRNQFTVIRPNTGQSFFDIERDELDSRYDRVTPEEAEEDWTASYEMTLTHCMHGKGCNQGAGCTTGRRLANITVLSGSVVRVWGTLESVLARHELELSRAERIMRVVRVEVPRLVPAGDTAPSHTSPNPGASPSGSMDLEIIDEASPAGPQAPRASPTAAPPILPGASVAPSSQIASQTALQPASQEAGTPVKAPTDKTTAATSTPGKQAGASPVKPAVITDHIVGVRYPAKLLPEVVGALQVTLLPQRPVPGMPAATQSAQPAVAAVPLEAAMMMREEPPTTVDKKWKTLAFQAPKTMQHYFKKQPGDDTLASQSGGSSQHMKENLPVGASPKQLLSTPHASSGTKRPAPTPPPAASFFKPVRGSGSVGSQRPSGAGSGAAKQHGSQGVEGALSHPAAAPCTSQAGITAAAQHTNQTGATVGQRTSQPGTALVQRTGPAGVAVTSFAGLSRASGGSQGSGGNPTARNAPRSAAAAAVQVIDLVDTDESQDAIAVRNTIPQQPIATTNGHNSLPSQPVQVPACKSEPGVDAVMHEDASLSDVDMAPDQGMACGLGAHDWDAHDADAAGTAVGRSSKKARVTGSETPPDATTTTANQGRSHSANGDCGGFNNEPTTASKVGPATCPPSTVTGVPAAGLRPGPAGLQAGAVGPGMSKDACVAQLQGMGFTIQQAERALFLSKGNLERAVELCLQQM